ncbi:MAG: NADPH-dependent FMN reductase, partial [Sphingobium sp.]
ANSMWHPTLSEMGMVVISSTLTVGPIAQTLDEQGKTTGDAGKSLDRAFPRFADDLSWWAQAAKTQRAAKAPPY